jgi:sulfur-oxidizing protein SoxB
MEHVLDQTAITYGATTLTEMSGETIKNVLEDVADNLFNADPYYQQGGDMVRVGGLEYAIDPNASMGQRIQDMRLGGKLIDASKTYKVAGWASVQPNVQGEPIWDVVAGWLRDKKVVSVKKVNEPRLIGIKDNQGLV